MIGNYSNGSSGSLSVGDQTVEYTVSNSNGNSPNSSVGGLDWGGVRTPGQQLLISFDTFIDEVIVQFSGINFRSEQASLVINGALVDLNDAIANGVVEVVSLASGHAINGSGELVNDGAGSRAISTFRIKQGVESVGIQDTSSERASTQVRFRIELDSTATLVCFAPGTLIETDIGPRPVETLQIGDMVATVDHGLRPLYWVHEDRVVPHRSTEDRPVLIPAGSLSPNTPNQDLIVSPQHRILVGEAGQLDSVFQNGGHLVPAKALVGLGGIRRLPARDFSWWHISLEEHDVITANGAMTESLLLGDMVWDSLRIENRIALEEIYACRKVPGHPLNGSAARPVLGKNKVARHLRQMSEATAV